MARQSSATSTLGLAVLILILLAGAMLGVSHVAKNAVNSFVEKIESVQVQNS